MQIVLYPDVSALVLERQNGYWYIRKRPTTDASAQNNGYDEPFQRRNDYDEIPRMGSCC